MRGRPQDPRIGLAALALAALGVRLVAIARWSRDLPLEGDQLFYHHQAIDLADWAGFTYRHPAGELVTTAVHPPLHTAWLGLVSLLGFEGPTAHRLAGALLGSATVVVGGLAAHHLAGRRAALATGAVLAVAPTLWINDALVLSESTYAFTVALVVLASVRYLASPDRSRALALGAAIALAGLARAEAAMLVLLLAVPLVLAANRGAGRRSAPGAGPATDAGPTRPGRWASLALVALGGLVVAAPWLGRNLTAFERPALVSSSSGFVLEIASCDETFYGERLGYWDVSCDRTPWAEGDETATEAAKRETALTYLGDNRGRIPVVVAARVARMWDVWRPAESVFLNDFFERRGEASSRWAIRGWWAMLVLAVPGAWALRRHAAFLWPFGALAVGSALAAALSFGITRYRTGLEVGVAVLAGVGVDAIVRALRRRSAARDDRTRREVPA